MAISARHSFLWRDLSTSITIASMQTTYLVRCALQQATSTDLARLLDKLKVIAGFGHDTDQLVTGVRFPYHHRLALNLSLVHISPQPFDVEIEMKKKTKSKWENDIENTRWQLCM